MGAFVFSDYAGDRLALIKAERERTLGPKSEPSADEAVLRAGWDGEQAVARRLLESCAEPFELVTGYHSSGGEIDIVLITPRGIVAIEVKTLNADVAVAGDCWVKRRRSATGDPIGEWYAIEDEGGRSPSRQVNEAADHLQRLLNRNGLNVRISRWIVLAHERSTIVKADDLTVDGVVTLQHLRLEALLGKGSVVPLTPIPVERVRVLAGRDHSAFRQRREVRSPGATMPPAELWPHAARLDSMVTLAKAAVAQGEAGVATEKLRRVIRHDLLVRQRPFDVPALLHALRFDPGTRDDVLSLVEEGSQIFEESDRCLLALTIPVAVRLRQFLNGGYAVSRVNPLAMASIEGVARGYYRLRRVAFDHRLYGGEALRSVGPQAMRQYMLDLADRGVQADSPLGGTTLASEPDGRWCTVHVVGVAVFDASEAIRARRISRLPLPGPFVQHPLTAFDPGRPGCHAPGVMHETTSVGICALAHGLTVGEQELRRLLTQVQAAGPEGRFMVPLRLAL